MKNNIISDSPIFQMQETIEEKSLDFQPKFFEEYLGQDKLKEKLRVYTQAAKQRNEPLDHLLLFGPPGLGKTTLAQIMAQVMQVNIRICSGPMLERTGDLVAILTGLESQDILFIDEIHRMPATIEEVLYSAMENFRVDVIIGQGVGAKSVNLPINRFTLIGATTKAGMISAPLRSRFGIIERFDYYNCQDLKAIVIQSANFLNFEISDSAALIIAKVGRGTPRIVKKILRRIRDFAQVNNYNKIDDNIVLKALEFLSIDTNGLTNIDYLILRTIIERFNGGPVGLETLSFLIGEDKETIEDVYEPYLMQQGYLEKTPRGRQISAKSLPSLKNKFLGQKNI